MNNFDIGKKVKELRNRKGFSQEELADLTQLSLRTIQRIENNETEARGDSLKRLATAFGIDPEELTDHPTEIDKSENANRNKYLIVVNLSAFSFLVFPMAGAIVPWVLWWLKKDAIKNIDIDSKRVINFQISWFIFITVIPMVIVVMTIYHISHFGIFNREHFLIAVIALYAFNIFYIILNTLRLRQNKGVIYKPAIPFIR
ncbi:hypothetical protein GCM10027049_06710 [Mucilaginibacter puniceus]